MARKIILIPEWKTAWKFPSFSINLIGVMLMTATEILGAVPWAHLPVWFQDKIPNLATIVLSLFVLSMLGRVLKTDKKSEPADDDQ